MFGFFENINWKELRQWLPAAVLAATAVITLIYKLFPSGKEFIKKVGQLVYFLRSPWYATRTIENISNSQQNQMDQIERKLDQIITDQKATDDSVQDIKKELSYNGKGSLKDIVYLQEIYRVHHFRTQNVPQFECNQDGSFQLVSDALCALCELPASNARQQLSALEWTKFIHPRDTKEFVENFREATKNRITFRGRSRWISYENNDLGEWETIATFLMEKKCNIGNDIVLYSGYLRPVDEISRAIAAKNGWNH